MFVLTDYDNISEDRLSLGFGPYAREITDAIVRATSTIPARLVFRLYGGWYEDQNPSRNGQRLAGELMADFPQTHEPALGDGTKTVLQAELAYSLLVSPTHHLLNTYRKKQLPHNLRAAQPKSHGCYNPECGLRHMKALIKKKKCPEQSCTVNAADLVWRSEQKLVDVMLAADLLDLVGRSSPDPLAVVTSDDDLWPAILLASFRAPAILHIHAKTGRTTATMYTRHASRAYTEIAMGA